MKPVVALDAGNGDTNPPMTGGGAKEPNPGSPYRTKYSALLIGVNMNQNPSGGITDYTSAIAAGTYDSQIDALGARLAELKIPVWVRIGVESNGSWNAYNATSFVAAFQHIVSRWDSDGYHRGGPIATVWNVNPDGNAYWPYYPGDSYVDWWSCNYLDVNETTGSNSTFWSNFIADAKASGPNRTSGVSMPIIIAEAGNGNGAALWSWSTFYVPFFSFITNSSNNIKAFIYVNYDWHITGSGGNQDMSMDTTGVIPANWRAELANNSNIVTNQTQSGLLAALGLTAPTAVYSGPTTVSHGTTAITLNGSTSNGGTGTLSCYWQYVSGPANPVFAANGGCSEPAAFPNAGTYQMKLTVQDSVGYNSAPASFSITAN